jgi:NADH-quinone oxidoreductase subunit I
MVMTDHKHRLEEARKPGFGIGLLKGMAVLLKHLFKRTTTIQYPDEKQDLSSRTRGVIALKEENCTVCMLCARECPDWCIYIDSHKETLPPKREGGRQRKRNVLDRFAIDYALCMYCGICVEVCPYDALFWSREFEYAEYDIRELTHEKERLSDWMASVLPPPPLEIGADVPDAPTAAAAQTTTPAAGARPATQTSSAAAARPAQAAAAPKAPTAAPTPARPKESEPGVEAERGEVAKAESPPEATAAQPAPVDQAPATTPVEEREGEPPKDVAEEVEKEAGVTDVKAAETQVPQVEVPHEAPRPVALEPVEDPEAVYQQVLEEQRRQHSSPQVAEARAKVARVKAERGIRRGPTPVEVDKPVPSAPTKAEQAAAPAEPAPSGAPEAEEPAPEQGPVAARPDEAAAAPQPEGAAHPETTDVAPPSGEGTEDPEAIYERVLAEERAKGSSEPVATARAKAARMRAMKGTKGPGS